MHLLFFLFRLVRLSIIIGYQEICIKIFIWICLKFFINTLLIFFLLLSILIKRNIHCALTLNQIASRMNRTPTFLYIRSKKKNVFSFTFDLYIISSLLK